MAREKWVSSSRTDGCGVPDMPALPANQYQCAMCEGVFEKGHTEEEARKEAKELFGIEDKDIEQGGEVALICDDCFKKMGFNSKDN